MSQATSGEKTRGSMPDWPAASQLAPYAVLPPWRLTSELQRERGRPATSAYQPRPHSLQRNRVPALDPSSLQHSGENADVSVIVLNNCAEHIGIFREIALR
jgi:hypothetical protein